MIFMKETEVMKKTRSKTWEMCTYTGASTDRSPNRLDACVYSIAAMNTNKKVLSASGMNFRV